MGASGRPAAWCPFWLAVWRLLLAQAEESEGKAAEWEQVKTAQVEAR